MNKFVKIGADLVSIDAISRVTFVENQSGISDRIIIQAGETEVVVDSAIGGRPRMDAIKAKLLQELGPEDWDASFAAQAPAVLPDLASQAA